VSDTACLPAITVEARLIDQRVPLERSDQVLIAAINGPTPMIAITRFML